MENSFDRTVIRKEQLLCIMEAVLDSIDSLKRYLLDPNSLMLNVDSIFVDYEYKRVGLVYVPGWRKDIILQLRELMEFLLGKIHQSDTNSVVLSWKLYLLLKEEHISLKEIRRTLRICEKTENGEEEEFPDRLEEERKEKAVLRQVRTEEEKENRRDWKIQKKLPGMVLICILGTILLALSEAGILYFIYKEGILEWKRNLLVINTIFLAAGICMSVFLGRKEFTKKRIRELLPLKNNSKRSWFDLM